MISTEGWRVSSLNCEFKAGAFWGVSMFPVISAVKNLDKADLYNLIFYIPGRGLDHRSITNFLAY